MDLELIFSLASTTALAGWLCLALLPMWRASVWIAGAIAPLLLCLAYAVLIASSFGSGASLDFSTLAGVRALFAQDQAVLIGWIHFLAFDLFIGAWEARDAKRVGVPHLLLLPCLFLTLMFGPIGFLLYFTIRTLRTRSLPALS